MPAEYMMSSSSERGPRHERDPAELSIELLGDFYQTFRLVQNEYHPQFEIFHLLGQEYQQVEEPESLAQALRIAGPKVDALMPPARHAATTEEQRNSQESGFRAMWNNFETSIQNPNPKFENPEMLLFAMLQRDLHYQRKPRPNRPAQEQHMSVVREYILGDGLSASHKFYSMQRKLRTALLLSLEEGGSPLVHGSLVKLANLWEANHTERYFDASVTTQPLSPQI